MIESDLTRRQFIYTGITTGIGAGFALAVLPTTAWAVATSDEGLVSGIIEIPVTGGKMPAYRAMPRGTGPFPVVLVVQEIFGIHEYIQDVCRRLARQGYLAVAPSLYFRQGDATKVEDVQKIVSEIVSKVPQTQVWSDLDSTIAWAEKTKTANASRIAITGFCWGGNVVWTYCTHSPKVKAGVAWYGKLSTTAGPAPAKTPIELAAELKAPVLGLYGEKDKGIPLEDVEKMRATLKQAKRTDEIIVFPGAEHGFHADYRPSFHEESAKEGWKKMLAWFKKNGV